MEASLSSAARLLRRALQIRLLRPKHPVPAASNTHYCTEARRKTLLSMIGPLGDPSINLTPELNRRVSRGHFLRPFQLQSFIKELRKRRRYRQALEVSEWMKNKKNLRFTTSDHAVQLDLIGHVHGLSSAENYFNKLGEKDEKIYGALLNCYVRERLTEKALSHMQKMKKLGLVSAPLPYNDIMSLYTNTDQHDKVPSVLEEMKIHGVLPDNFSYRICINSYGIRSDFESMERILEEMEGQPQIVVDWNTYSVVANIYIKAGKTDEALSALKKTEARLQKGDVLGYNHLISLYSELGDKYEMQRLWELQKVKCKKLINRDYTAMLGGLLKLGELEEAEALMKEWETSGIALDWSVPSVLLGGYRKRGLLEKAEAMLDDFLKKSMTPAARCWGIVAAGYAEMDRVDKAYELMLNALCLYTPKETWKPNPDIVKRILNYLSDEGKVEDVETFIGLLKSAIPADRDMYRTLIKAYVREGKEVGELLQRMETDGIEENDEIKEILSCSIKRVSLT